MPRRASQCSAARSSRCRSRASSRSTASRGDALDLGTDQPAVHVEISLRDHRPLHRRISALDQFDASLQHRLLVLALFWATNIFATKAGEVDGINAAGTLWPTETTIIVDTHERLFLPKELVKETPLTLADSPQGESSGTSVSVRLPSVVTDGYCCRRTGDRSSATQYS